MWQKKVRVDVLNGIYGSFPPDKWLLPSTEQSIKQQFVQRIREHLVKDGESWAFAGDWLHLRSDIVHWMWSDYWKRNGKRMKSSFAGASGIGSTASSGADDMRENEDGTKEALLEKAPEEDPRGWWNVV